MIKITFKNVMEFMEGNKNLFLENLIGKPDYFREQIIYRASKCRDCYIDRKCIICNCTLPGKHYVAKSCNKDRFPDLMNETDWNQYKKDNDIDIYLNE